VTSTGTATVSLRVVLLVLLDCAMVGMASQIGVMWRAASG
jgi:hypothetical protein